MSFDGSDIRPTSDMVRESLFNILRHKVIGCDFLDLFCGTGAVGLEALSRGAKRVRCNDFSQTSLSLAKKNADSLKVADQIEFSCLDAQRCLHTCGKFDVIFMDPPYKSGLGESALHECLNALNDDGIIILEDEIEFCSNLPDGLQIFDKRKYGRAYLTFFKRTEE